MTRRTIILLAIGFTWPIVAYLGWLGYARLVGPQVQSNKWVGRTESQLFSIYGKPISDMPEYQPLAMNYPASLPAGPIRTLIFHPRGLLRPEGGTLWVWVVEQNGTWVCFESCWHADGVNF